MCGIYCIIGPYKNGIFSEYFNRLKSRGPDNTQIKIINDITLGFHRLAIVDISDKANQPLKHKGKKIWLICNGEIFNCKELLEKIDEIPESLSDCEVILYLYDKYGMYETLRMLDGEFSFILYDEENNLLFASRDPFGVRPLFIGDSDENVCFSSEMKGIPNDYKIEHVDPGTYMKYDNSNKKIETTRYYHYNFKPKFQACVHSKITSSLTNAVTKRLMSDRPIGCLLSGGLDSSLVAAITARELKKHGKVLNTFSIGLRESTDLHFAKIVAEHIGSNHHEVIKTEEEFLQTIPKVIYATESYDVTTIRASTGHYLISEYIKNNTDIKVILSGEGSDEVAGGYLYFHFAPSPEEFHEESVRLLTNIHKFDVLRSDRCISSSHGLENRAPFLDPEFVETYLSTVPDLRVCGGRKREKDLLRKAFSHDDLLPKIILQRQKEGFSDGISGANSWYMVIRNYLESLIDSKDLDKDQTKEEYYYKKIFIDLFGEKNLDIIPFQWRPRWTDVRDPSARLL